MRVQRLTVKPGSKKQPTPLSMASGHSDLGLVLWSCLESLLQSSWVFNNQPLRSSALPQCTASVPMWVVRGFLPLRYLAIFCLNKFMPWINIVCELNCLLGKQGEMNRILRNLVWNQFLEWGCMCLGLWNWTPKEAPCFPKATSQLGHSICNQSSPSPLENDSAYHRVVGQEDVRGRLHSAWCAARLSSMRADSAPLMGMWHMGGLHWKCVESTNEW